jgi:methionyl-tRNA formyltransferase
MLNVHPSLLPRWRGAAPIERAIMSGDEVTGVSIMQVGEGFDDGPVCAQASEPITADDTYGSLAARLEELGAGLLIRALDESPPCAPQDEELATYAAKIDPADRALDPSRPAVELERTIRALTPHIGAQVTLGDGERLGVTAARVLPDGPPQGEVWLEGPRPVLGCAEGALELLSVQPPGRRAMSGEDFLRGRRR